MRVTGMVTIMMMLLMMMMMRRSMMMRWKMRKLMVMMTMAALMVFVLQDIIELDLNNDWEVSPETILTFEEALQ